MTALSSRSAVVTVSLADLLYVVQGGIGRKLTIGQLRDKIKEYTLNGLSIQKDAVSISTSDTITLNFVGSTLSATKAGSTVTITSAANAKISFAELGTPLGTSGTVTSITSDVGIAFTRTGDEITIGLRSTIVNDSTTSRSLSLSDIGKSIRFTSNSAVSYTFIPIVDLLIGSKLKIRQVGLGKVTLVGAGVTLNIKSGATGTLAQHTTIEAEYVDTNTWDIEGQVG